MTPETLNHIRLSDRILSALELAIEQGDLEIAEQLNKALESSMTRMAGGGEFVERRHYSEQIENVMKKLSELRNQA